MNEPVKPSKKTIKQPIKKPSKKTHQITIANGPSPSAAPGSIHLSCAVDGAQRGAGAAEQPRQRAKAAQQLALGLESQGLALGSELVTSMAKND